MENLNNIDVVEYPKTGEILDRIKAVEVLRQALVEWGLDDRTAKIESINYFFGATIGSLLQCLPSSSNE